jgi:fatty acid synthase subunit alpha
VLDSIGAEILKLLVSAGATVLVSTSSFGLRATQHFRSIYEIYGSKGSEIIVLPFNQASVQDIKAVIDHVYDDLKLDLDAVIPFGNNLRPRVFISHLKALYPLMVVISPIWTLYRN